jgi:hypothetical protein
VSSPERNPPPVGEEVHVPGPTILPALTGLGITLALVGVTTYIAMTIIGGILTIICAVLWIKDTRHEVDELPLDTAQRD